MMKILKNKKNYITLISLFLIFNAHSMYRDVNIIFGEETGIMEREEDGVLQRLGGLLLHKAAPIIVSCSVWNRFAHIIKDFHDALQEQPTEIPNAHQFMAVYYLTQNAIDASSKNDASSILAEINTPEYFTKVKEIAKDMLTQGFEKFNKLALRWQYYVLPFNPSEWDIYLKDNLLILIPHTYKEKMISTTKGKLEQFTFKTPIGRRLTQEEIALAIKTNDLQPIILQNKNFFVDYEAQLKEIPSFTDRLKNIFLTKEDIEKEENRVYYPFTWNIFINGHGLYFLPPRETIEIESYSAQIEAIRKKIASTIGFYPERASDIDSHLKTLEHNIKRLKQTQDLEKTLSELNSYKENLLLLQSKIEKILIENKTLIVGIPYEKFKTILQFFDHNVHTNILCYQTCFSGERNLIFPYTSIWGAPERYHYTIVASTISDKVIMTTLSKRYEFMYPRKIIFNPENIYFSQENGKTKVFFIPSVDFGNWNSFFESLHTDTLITEGKKVPSLFQVLQYAHPKELILEQVPAIRYPGGPTFNALDINTKTARITKVLLSAAQLKGELPINTDKTKFITFYTYFIPIPINVTGSDPLFSSMIHKPTALGVSSFYIKKLKTQSDIYFIYNSMIHEERDPKFYENPIPKMFLIDKFTDRYGKEYENVMMFNKITLPLSIQGDTLYMTGLLYKQKKQNSDEYEIILDGNKYKKEKAAPIDSVMIKLAEKAINDYNQLYATYKKQIFDQAQKDNLTLIPLQTIEDVLLEKLKKIKYEQLKEKKEAK